MIVDIFIPCFIDQIYPETAHNMISVLEKLGCEVHYNSKQTCCGQPAFNNGFWGDAKVVGEKFINDYPNERFVVSPSGSCTGYVRNYYGELFENSRLHNQVKQLQTNLFEFSEFIVDVLKVEDVGASLQGKATYHDSCAALRECNVKDAPRKLLQNVKGLELVEMEESDTCCGFGGTFSVKFEAIATSMTEQKVDNALKTEANYLVSTDLSCLMHMDGYIQRNNKPIKIMHIADVLAQN